MSMRLAKQTSTILRSRNNLSTPLRKVAALSPLTRGYSTKRHPTRNTSNLPPRVSQASLLNLNSNKRRAAAAILLLPLAISSFATFFSSSTRHNMSDSSFPIQKSESEWRAVLSPEQFRVIRQQGTEAPYTGEYDKHSPTSGTYDCAACGTPLYKASHKFKSGCGWPAYFDSLPGAVVRRADGGLGMQRTEIVCAKCGGHLGHVFKGEGYATPTDERHCVNSVSIKFAEGDEQTEQKAEEGTAQVEEKAKA